MAEPLVVTISHRLGRETAKRRLQEGMGPVRAQLAGLGAAVEDSWTGDRMDFRLGALGQTITGHIEVLDELVRVEVSLPGVLGWLGGRIADRVRRQATLLLGKP